MTLYPQNATSKGTCPTPSPSVVFTFGFTIESIKELRGASTTIVFFSLCFVTKWATTIVVFFLFSLLCYKEVNDSCYHLFLTF